MKKKAQYVIAAMVKNDRKHVVMQKNKVVKQQKVTIIVNNVIS
jgi:hypothetical protein